MIMDAQLLASDGQAITATAVSTNAIDFGGRDISRGEPIRAVARASAAFVGGTSIRADLVESDTSNLGAPNTLVTGPTVNAGATAGGASLLDAVVPKVSRRYVGFNYTVVGGPMTAGAVTSGLVLQSDSGSAFPATTGL